MTKDIEREGALETACAEVSRNANPAYVKDSELRYIAVNEAYAALWDVSPAVLIGRESHRRPEACEHDDRDEKERRSLVFGKDQVALLAHPLKGKRFRIRIHRERQVDGKPFIFGHFEPIAGVRFEDRQADGSLPVPARPAEDEMNDAAEARMHEAFDKLDVGVVLYGPDETLLYANPAAYALIQGAYRMEPGMKLREVLERAWAARGVDDDRDEWVEARLQDHHAGGEPYVFKLKTGTWMRVVNRRLDDGSILGIRMDLTDLYEHEEALKRKEHENDLFRAALDALPIPTFIKDRNFNYVFANQSLAGVANRPAGEIIGNNDFTLFGKQSAPIRESDIEVMHTGKPKEIEIPMRRPGNEELSLLSRKTRFTSPDGNSYLLGSTMDITPQKQREKDLQAAREEAEHAGALLSMATGAMAQGLLVVGGGKVLFVNDSFLRMLDVPADVVAPGRNWTDYLEYCTRRGDYEGEEELRGTIVDSIEQGRPYTVERQGGKDRWLRINGLPTADGSMVITYTDISDVKRRERDLHAAREEIEQAGATLRMAAGAMAQGLFIVKDGRTQFVNQTFRDMLQVPPELTAPGSAFQAYVDFCAERGDFDATGREETRRKIVEDAENGVPYANERQLLDGRWVKVDAQPTGQGALVVTYTDVTEAKKREEELSEFLQKAEAADRAKSEFLANMSHEIRTPMNGVLGMAELLSRTDLDSRQKTFTDIIVKSGTALLAIINDILDFSKIDAGQMVLENASFDLRETMEDVATLVSSRAVEKDVELVVRIEPSLDTRVIGDVGRVRQIITNLVGNAVKFTEIGHVLVALRAERTHDGLLDLEIRVEDTGIGIPAEKLQSVFEKFSQVDTSSTRRYEGTGLGLAITSRLVDLMGGKITAESTVGAGSVFTVGLRLPLDQQSQSARTVPIDVTGARVLVIDDNAVNRQIVAEQLAAWGFDGCAAESGDEGERVIEAAEAHGCPVDVVILDYHMPERNGAQVARSIRSAHPAGKLPIIMLTSMDVKNAEPGLAELGIEATLMKPARSSLLLETLIEVLQVSQQFVARRHEPPVLRIAASASPTNAKPAAAEGADNADAGHWIDEMHRAGGGEAMPRAAAARVAKPAQVDILVAEDNEVNQIVFTQILDDLGARFVIVDNGEAAVESWKNLRPALILMDVSMPGMNGHEATSAIRNAEAGDPAFGRTPIIGVTAHALTGDRERCLEAGMDDYLSKPISPEKLESKIREWMPADALSRMQARS